MTSHDNTSPHQMHSKPRPKQRKYNTSHDSKKDARAEQIRSDAALAYRLQAEENAKTIRVSQMPAKTDLTFHEELNAKSAER